MPVIPLPEGFAGAPWMRHALLVAALAEAGLEGAEVAVPGPTLERSWRRLAP